MHIKKSKKTAIQPPTVTPFSHRHEQKQEKGHLHASNERFSAQRYEDARKGHLQPLAERLPAKNFANKSAHSASRTPPITSGRAPTCGSRGISQTEPHAPSLASHAPNTIRPTWACNAAPAHIGHGSSVTTSVQSARFQAFLAAISRLPSAGAESVKSPTSIVSAAISSGIS